MSAEEMLEAMGPRPCAGCGDDLREALRVCSSSGAAWCGECGTVLEGSRPRVRVPTWIDPVNGKGKFHIEADLNAAEDWDPRVWRGLSS